MYYFPDNETTWNNETELGSANKTIAATMK
jgi:hypothetical protein